MWQAACPLTLALSPTGARGLLWEASGILDRCSSGASPGRPYHFEMKWAGPDGMILDISHTGWDGTS